MNYTNSSHPALGALKPEELAAFNRLSPELQVFFTQRNNLVGGQPEYGAPNDITPAGCLALAKLSNQHPDAQGRKCALWNEWRRAFPPKEVASGRYVNVAQFQKVQVNSDLSFRGFEFGNKADFSEASFKGFAEFTSAVFGDQTSFFGAQFVVAIFGESKARGRISFERVHFFHCSFYRTRFKGYASFSDSIFEDEAFFVGAHFSTGASFQRAYFKYSVKFESVVVDGALDFCCSCFLGRERGELGSGLVDFSGAVFRSGCLNLQDVYSRSDMDFSIRNPGRAVAASQLPLIAAATEKERTGLCRVVFTGASLEGGVSFANRVFLDSACFKRTEFSRAPIFHGCTLHPDTSFEGAVFPPDRPDFKGQGEAAMRAYRTLKLKFNELHATREEQRFFRYEMVEELKLLAKAVANGPVRNRFAACGRFLTFWLYSFLSDWGFSLWRPLAFLVLLPALAAYVIHLAFAAYAGASLAAISTWASAFEYTLLRGLPGFDARAAEIGKVLFTNLGAPERLALTLVDLGLKACLLLGFFLAGLALRNRFKIK